MTSAASAWTVFGPRWPVGPGGRAGAGAAYTLDRGTRRAEQSSVREYRRPVLGLRAPFTIWKEVL
jgi:hypothetical protein